MIDHLSLAEIWEMQRILIDRYGGTHGIRDVGAVESALYRAKSDSYKDVITKAAALMESLVVNRPFLDGNKRIAFAAHHVFLSINGYQIQQQPSKIHVFMTELIKNNQFELAIIEQSLRQVVTKRGSV